MVFLGGKATATAASNGLNGAIRGRGGNEHSTLSSEVAPITPRLLDLVRLHRSLTGL